MGVRRANRFPPFSLPGQREDLAAAFSTAPQQSDFLGIPGNILGVPDTASAQGALTGFAGGFGQSLGQGGSLTEALIGGFGGSAAGLAQGGVEDRAHADAQAQQQAQQQQQQAQLQAQQQQQLIENAQAERAEQLARDKFIQGGQQFEQTLGAGAAQEQRLAGQFETEETRLNKGQNLRAKELGLKQDIFKRGPKLDALVPVFDSETGETRFKTRADAVGQLAPPKSGFEIVTDPATGQTTVRTGVTGGSGLGKKAINQLESKSIDMTAARERLNNIAAEFKPEFLTLQNRFGMGIKAAQDKVGLLPPEQQAELADFTRFQQNTIKNLNSTIREITGAAMNQAEVPRIMREVPNENDSPAMFESKLRNALKLTGLAQARLAHLRNQGLPAGTNFGGIELDEMPSIMDDRGGEIEAQLIQQGFDPQVAEQQALAQVRQEFGF